MASSPNPGHQAHPLLGRFCRRLRRRQQLQALAQVLRCLEDPQLRGRPGGGVGLEGAQLLRVRSRPWHDGMQRAVKGQWTVQAHLD